MRIVAGNSFQGHFTKTKEHRGSCFVSALQIMYSCAGTRASHSATGDVVLGSQGNHDYHENCPVISRTLVLARYSLGFIVGSTKICHILLKVHVLGAGKGNMCP